MKHDPRQFLIIVCNAYFLPFWIQIFSFSFSVIYLKPSKNIYVIPEINTFYMISYIRLIINNSVSHLDRTKVHF